MRAWNRSGSRWGFFGPFYKTQRGHIYGLASPRDHMRDGLATTLIGRHFPLPEFDGIVVEPSRRNVVPAENLILVGAASLFVDPDAHGNSGNSRQAPVAAKKLEARLRRIDAECCYRFEGTTQRAVVNGVTRERYVPQADAESGITEDYGVIRRVFKGPLENTILLEGVHRLGTLGAAKVATSSITLDAIWDAVSGIPAFDESLPLEILVHATFHDDMKQGVYSLDEVSAVPLHVVYNRQWIFDLGNGHRWRDQLPWDVARWARSDAPAADVPAEVDGVPLPRVEVDADLRAASSRVRRATRKILCAGNGANGLEAPPPPTADEQALLRELVDEADRFRVVLVQEGPFAANERHVELPQGRSHIRGLRKQFFLHLALCRLMGRGFRCDENSIRALFPKFEGGATAKPFASQFVGSVAGRMREGFGPLLGTARKPGNFLRIDFSKKSRTYALRLERAALVLKLRL